MPLKQNEHAPVASLTDRAWLLGVRTGTRTGATLNSRGRRNVSSMSVSRCMQALTTAPPLLSPQVGLKLPKLSLRCTAADVFAGETVTVKVSAQRLHVYTAAELERYNATASGAASGVPAEEGAPPPGDSAKGDAVVRVPDAHEGWWLLVGSVRSALIKDAQLRDREVHHNVLVGRQTLVPSLDDATMESSIEFTAPSAPGEYRVLVHLRSSSMVGVDVKRKVSFTVKSGKRSQPSTSSGTSTDDTKSMEEIDGTIADIIQEEEASTAPSTAPNTAPNTASSTAPSTASLPTATPSPPAPAVPVS